MINPYTKQLKTVIFDIETMGLMPYKDMVINAGFCDPETGEVVQLFAESKEDEKRLIEDIYAILSKYDVVVTYNGDRFDIPFIKTRAKKYSIESFPLFWSIDMYRYLRKYWPMAERMKHLNQKSVEVALGLSEDRDDEIGGGECIHLYEHYLGYRDQESKDLILLHNSDDVKQLARIYMAANFLPYDQIAFDMGFGIEGEKFILCKGIRFDNHYIYVDAVTKPGGIPASIYEDGYELEYNCFSGDTSLKIMLYNRDGLNYVDLNNLPINKEDFKDLAGYHSDFLVISNRKECMYREINTLVRGILKKCI